MKAIAHLFIFILIMRCNHGIASDLKDTSANRFPLVVGKSLSLGDYDQLLSLSVTYLKNGKLDEGINYLSKGIRQLDAQKKVMRVNGYFFYRDGCLY